MFLEVLDVGALWKITTFGFDGCSWNLSTLSLPSIISGVSTPIYTTKFMSVGTPTSRLCRDILDIFSNKAMAQYSTFRQSYYWIILITLDWHHCLMILLTRPRERIIAPRDLHKQCKQVVAPSWQSSWNDSGTLWFSSNSFFLSVHLEAQTEGECCTRGNVIHQNSQPTDKENRTDRITQNSVS